MTINTEELAHLVADGTRKGGDLELADALLTGDYVDHGGRIAESRVARENWAALIQWTRPMTPGAPEEARAV